MSLNTAVTTSLKNLSECYHYARRYTDSLKPNSNEPFTFNELLVQDALRENFKKYKYMSSQSVANIWNILKYCQYQLSANNSKIALRTVPEDIKSALIKETKRLHQVFNSQEISNIFASFAQLNVIWHDKSLDGLRDKLLNRLMDKLPEMHHLGVKLSLVALQKLFKKEHAEQVFIPELIQKTFHAHLVKAINQNVEKFDAKDLHLILAGYTDMRHHLPDCIHPAHIEPLFHVIEKNCDLI